VAIPARPEGRAVPLPRITVETVLYGLIIVGAFTIRIWDAGSRAMHGDEAVHAWLAWNLYNGTGYQYDPVYHGPLQFPLTALFYFLFGVSNLSGRLLSILFGTALVSLPFFLRHQMGRWAALLSSALIALSPAFVYTSRLERDDMLTCLFAMTMAIALFSFVRTRQTRYVYLGVCSIALSLSAMENTYITLFVFGTFLLIVLAGEYASRLPASERFFRAWRITGQMHHVSLAALGTYLALLAVAFVLTVAPVPWIPAFVPFPTVLVLGLVAWAVRQAMVESEEGHDTRFTGAVRSVSRQQWLNAGTIALAILFLLYSTFGANLRGVWDASQPILNTNHVCAGNPFVLNPCRKDVIGGLFYWLSQHEVHRGGQPWFYYTLLFSLYEQIVVLFGLGGIIWFWRHPTLFTTFLTYWAVLMFGIYSWAGEKFPWLMVHPLLPFTLLSAMFVVDLLRLRSAVRYLTLAVLAVLLALEVHSTFEVNFVNGADPVEMMVYVQSSPQTPQVAGDILSLSNKVTNGNDLHVTIDNDDTWPFAWYLRDMPNVAYPSAQQLKTAPYSTNPVIIVDESHLADITSAVQQNYSYHQYRLRWWFPEDYKSLTWNSTAQRATDPGTWRVMYDWLIDRRPFGPKPAVLFDYYVKHGLASPY